MPAVHNVMQEVVSERDRQDAKWGEQNHKDGTVTECEDGSVRRHNLKSRAMWDKRRCESHFAVGTGSWFDILEEEVSEAYAADTEEELRSELVQVAAVAVAWIEALDRRINAET